MTKCQVFFEIDRLNKMSKNNLIELEKNIFPTEFFKQSPITDSKIKILELMQERCVKEAKYTRSLQTFLKKKLELSRPENQSDSYRNYLNLHLRHSLKELEYNLFLENNQIRINAIMESMDTSAFKWDSAQGAIVKKQ